jgi:uncharacterized protein (TIRG00374 family)
MRKNYTPEQTLKRSKKSIWMSVGFIFLNIAVVVVIALLDFNGERGAPWSTLRAVLLYQRNYLFLIAAAGLMLLVFACDFLKMVLGLYSSTGRVRPAVAYKSVALGRYYDSITPFAIGGQPFQVHYLSQKDMHAHEALSSVMIAFFFHQITYVLITPVFLIIGTLSDNSVLIKIFAWVGYLAFTSIPATLLLMTVKPRLAMAIVNFFLRILKKLRILKHPDKLSRKIDESLNKYRSTLTLLKKHPVSAAAVCLLSVIHYFAFFAIPYFVCRALGASAADTVNLFTQMVMITFVITIVPTPGNSVAAEFSFRAVFLTLLGSLVFFGMLFWRLMIFYVYILQGIILITIRGINNAIRAHRAVRALSTGMSADMSAESGEDMGAVKEEDAQ